MATVKSFEELETWKKSKEITTEIYKAFQSSKDFGFKDQIQRASVSIMNSIAEGFEYNSHKSFKRFLTISKSIANLIKHLTTQIGNPN